MLVGDDDQVLGFVSNVGQQFAQRGNARGDFAQRRERRRDVLEEVRAAFHESEKSIRAERLHEPLHRAQIERREKIRGDVHAGID